MAKAKSKTNSKKQSRVRDAKTTRQALVDAAFDEIYRNGFQATSLDDIIATVGVTKGALYYYFPSKIELGYAVIEEKVRPRVDEFWLPRIKSEGNGSETTNHLDILINNISANFNSIRTDIKECGCPLNNLAQEMSPLNDEFRKRLNDIFEYWRVNLAKFISAGQKRGDIRNSVKPSETAGFIVAAIEGIISTYKSSEKVDNYPKMGRQLVQYLESLRAPADS